MLQWLGRAGKARLLRSLQKSSDFEAFIKDASPGIVELDEIMPLIDVLGIKRGQLYSDALQHMVSMLKGVHAGHPARSHTAARTAPSTLQTPLT